MYVCTPEFIYVHWMCMGGARKQELSDILELEAWVTVNYLLWVLRTKF